MSILSKLTGKKRTYKDKHGATVTILSEAQGPNRKQRRRHLRVDHGIPWYDKEPHISMKEARARRVKRKQEAAHARAVERKNSVTRMRIEA